MKTCGSGSHYLGLCYLVKDKEADVYLSYTGHLTTCRYFKIFLKLLQHLFISSCYTELSLPLDNKCACPLVFAFQSIKLIIQKFCSITSFY